MPWHFLRERKGVVIKWVPVATMARSIWERSSSCSRRAPRWSRFTHMSNVLGTIVPVKEVVRLAHEAGAKVLIDGSQGAVHLKVDVQESDADFYAFTGHKLYGPTGIGVLAWQARGTRSLAALSRRRRDDRDGQLTERVLYGQLPHKFEAGTPPILEAIGLGAAIDWLTAFDREAVAAHELRLMQHGNRALARASTSVKLYGLAEPKGSIISFAVEGAHAHDVATILDRYGVAVRAGTHCAEPLMARLGVTSTARASLRSTTPKKKWPRSAKRSKKRLVFCDE